MDLPRTSRRKFLGNVGCGMLVAGIGYSASRDLGLAPAWAEETGPERLTFGANERLVSLMQETPPDQLLPKVVELIRTGTELRAVVSAAALANARAFGGEDYIGFHTFMAMMPAYRMALALPKERQAIPILKVLHRNASRLQESGHASDDVLHPIAPSGEVNEANFTDVLRESIHRQDATSAERALASAAGLSPDEAWNDLLPTVMEAPEVHRIVLAHRCWDMLNMVGIEHAETMLRQSVRFCINGEEPRRKYASEVPGVVTRLLDDHKLLGRGIGTKTADDAWIDNLVKTLFNSSRHQAADAIAAALAEGFSPDAISEAISLTANQLLLYDRGRFGPMIQANKPAGSVHGDSVGVHASDSANAWRHVARAANPRNAMVSLILAGWHVAQDHERGGNFDAQPRPFGEDLEKITSSDPSELLTQIDGAIRDGDQNRSCALVHRYLEAGHSEKPVFEILLRHSTSEDGALHAEKYFWTVNDEFALTRPAFRNRQVVALARVCASQYGYRGPGYEQACRLLGCEV